MKIFDRGRLKCLQDVFEKKNKKKRSIVLQHLITGLSYLLRLIELILSKTHKDYIYIFGYV